MLQSAVDGLEEVLAGGGGILGVERVGAKRGRTMVEEKMGGVVYGDVETGVWREG